MWPIARWRRFNNFIDYGTTMEFELVLVFHFSLYNKRLKTVIFYVCLVNVNIVIALATHTKSFGSNVQTINIASSLSISCSYRYLLQVLLQFLLVRPKFKMFNNNLCFLFLYFQFALFVSEGVY